MFLLTFYDKIGKVAIGRQNLYFILTYYNIIDKDLTELLVQKWQ